MTPAPQLIFPEMACTLGAHCTRPGCAAVIPDDGRELCAACTAELARGVIDAIAGPEPRQVCASGFDSRPVHRGR